MSIGWIVSKIEGGGGSIEGPPPSSARVTIFLRGIWVKSK